MKKNQIVLLIVAVVVLGGAVSGVYYYQTQPATQTPSTSQFQSQSGVPTPRFAEAKQKCIDEDLTIERRDEDMGSWTASYDICIFPNGSECESLGYLEGTCVQSQFKKWSMLNPVAF